MFDDISDNSSELSSPPSSPIPPPDFYPTPTPSQDLDGLDTGPTNDCDDMPPTKRRRKIEPKPRTTQHLDLRATSVQAPSEQREQFDLLEKALRNRRKIVVIAGAGISVSAGSTCPFFPTTIALPDIDLRQYPISALPMDSSRLCEANIN